MVNPKIVPVAIGVSLLGVTAVVVYLLYKKEQEEKEDEETISRPLTFSIEMPVPIEAVSSLIGRGGSNIKEIEKSTKTKINFKDLPSSKGLDSELIKERICVIRGNSLNVKAAQNLIKNSIQEKEKHSDSSISVPQWAVSKIIGKNGNNIRDISHKSGAKIKVEDFAGTTAAQRKVSVKGTRDQIKKATDAIEACISSEKLRRENDFSVSRREPRKKNVVPASLGGDNDTGMALKSSSALESPSPETGALLEVFVSAISSPSRFWVQIVGKQVEELDKLVDQMTDYYSNPDNREFHKLVDVHIGQIVAAVFRHDGKWYRAKVVEIRQNEFDSRQQVCDLHFVDYGDNEYVAKDELYELRTDMLRLRFQAMECFLAGVAPINVDATEIEVTPYPKWDPKAIERFEDLTQACRWKRLWSRTCAFRERPIIEPSTESTGETPRNTREGSPIPGVKLYDTKEGKDIDIAQVLIDEEWAVAVEEKPLSRPPPTEVPAMLPPTFGDLECSRVLGMVIGGNEKAHNDSPVSTSDHHGESIAELPKHDKPAPKDTADPSHKGDQLFMNGSTKTTNGTAAHHNESFLNSERGKAHEAVKSADHPVKPLLLHDIKDDMKAKINRVDSHHGNLESLNRLASESPTRHLEHDKKGAEHPKPLHQHDSKDDLKAKINRVDSHHGNLDSLSRQTPESPTKHFHKDDFKAKINRVESHHGNLEDLGKHTPPLCAIQPPVKLADTKHPHTDKIS